MKVLVILALGVLAVLLLGSCEFEFSVGGKPVPSPKASVENVNDILNKATQAGAPPKAGTSEARLNALCARRERQLAALARPRGLAGIAPHAQRILAILRAHSKRARAPREVRALDAEQQRALLLLARAARSGNYRAAQAQAMALRELAGRANSVFLRLGLTQCAIRATAMPL